MSLDELRKKIDEADDRIVKLIADRIRQAQEIGQEKQKIGMQIEDTAREERAAGGPATAGLWEGSLWDAAREEGH